MVRTDMPLEQIIVQANHAAYESGLQFPAVSTTVSSLISLHAKDKDALIKTKAYLDSKGIRYTEFHEPSWEYGLTALATEPLTEDRRKAMKRFSLVSRKHVDIDMPLPGKSLPSAPIVTSTTADTDQASLTQEGIVAPNSAPAVPVLYDTQKALYNAMRATMQHGTQDVFAHGVAVNQSFRGLVQYLETGDATELPAEVLADMQNNAVLPALHAKLKHTLLPASITDVYQVWHDCGKPLCAQNGHFPNHAQLSAKQWLHLFPEDTLVAELMANDMLFHLAKSDTANQAWQHPYAYTLYLTAWAEVYANASMFGGMDSDSFKIKRKRLIQTGKKML